ncbi:SRPBCC domain-containing protein [bacterium]|nr:SRPBCC domain-containing protein [bacterium]
MSQQAGKTIRKEIFIEADPEIVFPYFTQSKKLLSWLGIEATADPKPGGIYRVVVIPSHIEVGEFVEVDPPNRVVYTYGHENDPDMPPGSTRVEITLTPEGSGTRVRVVHSQLPEGREHYDIGWTHYLERLQIAAAGGDPGRDPWLDSPPG